MTFNKKAFVARTVQLHKLQYNLLLGLFINSLGQECQAYSVLGATFTFLDFIRAKLC